MRRHLVPGPPGVTRSLQAPRSRFLQGGTRRISVKCCRYSACAATSQLPAIPHELPLFPVQPIGVFLPGMTKTLHLYEPHFISLVEECLTSEHRLMATAVLEPYMRGPRGGGGGSSEGGGSDSREQTAGGEDAGPGSFVGGYNFSLSCGCLVQVLSAKPYTGGYLVRIRGEARLGISGLPQTGPYMRAQVYPLPDQPPEGGQWREAELRFKVQRLRDVMRDVQNLASKFRCDETAALQQAMRWLHSPPLAPGFLQQHKRWYQERHHHEDQGWQLDGAHQSQQQQRSGENHPHPQLNRQGTVDAGAPTGRATHGSAMPTGCMKAGEGSTSQQRSGSPAAVAARAPGQGDSGCLSGGEDPRQRQGCAQQQQRHREEEDGGQRLHGTEGTDGIASGKPDGSGHGRQEDGSMGRCSSAAAAVEASGGSLRDEDAAAAGTEAGQQDGRQREDEEAFDPEEAVRWSWAALQWLPHASAEERMYVVRTRLLAADTRDVGRRLDLVLAAMEAARASLAAKCAIKGAL